VKRLRALGSARRSTSSRTRSLADLDLLDFIPAVSPRYVAPRHLAPLCALYERVARGERVLAVVSAPPRHGKTECELHALAWLLAKRPEMQLAFVGYAARFAEKKSRKARELAKKAGVALADDAQSRQDWRTGVEDGGLWATSIGGQITGEGFHFAAIDDPVKDRATAESATARDNTYEWFTDTLFTRLEPEGSCIVTQTRWHEADLGGRLIKEGWESVNLPAIDDEGEALWPDRFSLEHLGAIRQQLGDYGWYSLYQGQPRPRGGAVFGPPATFTSDPALSRTVIGIDFAYTAKTHADYSVAVVMADAPPPAPSLAPAPSSKPPPVTAYVLDVVRQQVTAPEFAASLRALRHRYPQARMVAYVGGTEKGIVDLLNRDHGLRIEAKAAKADKFVRAQATAAAWNDNPPRIGVREGAPWAAAFLDEVCGFTGVGDAHDDCVDAMVAAFDALSVRAADVSDFTSPRFRI
jgi:predicted phage terminase large subunit-like protein